MTRIKTGTSILQLELILPFSNIEKELSKGIINKNNNLYSNEQFSKDLEINRKSVLNLSSLIIKSAFKLAESRLPIKTKTILC